MSTRTLTALVAALMLGAIGLAACGGDDQDTAAPPPAGGEQPAAGGPVQVAADPNGALAYVQDSLSAQAGTVTFRFTNEAPVPHDFNIEQDGEKIAGTEVITQGQETLTVELKPGRYVYYCSVGAHRPAGMEGPLTVE